MQELSLVHYIPVLTTVLSALFLAALMKRYYQRNNGWAGPRQAQANGTMHLLFWSLGIFTYGLGTALEASITLMGNSIALTKAWYIAGALLGGYPLAQGSVYLHLGNRWANRLTAITLPIIVGLSLLVIISPVHTDRLLDFKPSGSILAWEWIRWGTPFINLYSVIFLIGGAIVSAWKFARTKNMGHRALGNTLIAIGAILPGIGGTMAKAGIVEGLYIGEFIGIIFIWCGYKACLKS